MTRAPGRLVFYGTSGQGASFATTDGTDDTHQVSIRILLLRRVAIAEGEIMNIDLAIFLLSHQIEALLISSQLLLCSSILLRDFGLRRWDRIDNRPSTLVVELAKELLVLLYSSQLHLIFLFLRELFVEDLGSWDAGLLEKHLRLQPAISHL